MVKNNTLGLMWTVALGAVVLASCSLFEGLRAGKTMPEGPRVFTHKAHQEDFECIDCHTGAREEAEAGMPTLESCVDCHDEPDEGSTIEKAIHELQAREKAGKPLWRTPAVSDTKFHHGEHLEDVTYILPSGQKKPLECEDCHAKVGASEVLPVKTSPPMELCTDCHAQGKPADKEGGETLPATVLNACSFCHEKMRSDVRPVDHRGLWRVVHGEEIKFGFVEEESKRCTYCHRDDFCTDCHMRDAPRSHTRFFRLRGHGIDAGMSRDRCSTCHLEDFCIRCHTAKRPLSHTPSWSARPHRHCTGCHLPLSMTRCTVCHKHADHNLAPLFPRDANHTGTCLMNCHLRQHPEPGAACTTCHK
ncbi:MAG: hypothetical protein ACYTHM_12110 [Planctomycetota bacterium]|jgi:hypothetical protein